MSALMIPTAPRSRPLVRGDRPGDLLADLEAGRLRAAEPDPTAPDGWRIRPDVKTAILACFADRTMVDSAAGPLRVPRPGRGPAPRTTSTAGRGGSCPAGRPCAAALTSATGSS